MKALTIQEAGKATVNDVQEPELGPDWVKVKTAAVGLNPTDWKHVYTIPTQGTIVGCDFSGVVEQVGTNVTSVKPGDKIAGGVHGSNVSGLGDGSFAEHLRVKDGIFLKLGDKLSFAEGATLGVGVVTIGQGLYRSLKLPPVSSPATTPFPLLVYGGSTGMGTLAIQYAKLSGAHVIATASPHNFDLVKSYGADEVLDYKDPDVGSKIRKLTDNKLRLAFDTVSGEGAQKICAEALSSDGSLGLTYSTLLPGSEKGFPRDDVEKKSTLYYQAFGETYEKRGKTSKADPEEYEFTKAFWKQAESLFAEGKLRVHPIDERQGLENVVQGLEDLKAGKVSAKKIVYTLSANS